MDTTIQLEVPPAIPRQPFADMVSHLNRDMAGVSPAWQRLCAQVKMVAPHAQLATIEGEPGSGKETLARFLHSLGPHARMGFQRNDAREWLVKDCDPSTMSGFFYLDRVDLLAESGQGLLLGVLKSLQNHATERCVLVLSSQTPIRQMMSQGMMMPDLAFRLTAVRFTVPPLRQRKEDIVPLALAIIERVCNRYQHRRVTLTQAALARLLHHRWPGNLRELASVLESALLEAADGVIRAEDLLISPEPRAEAPLTAPTRGLLLEDIIRHHVQYVLELNRGNKLRAARQLGISRSTLYRILSHQALLAS